jgi:hypothetical protein
VTSSTSSTHGAVISARDQQHLLLPARQHARRLRQPAAQAEGDEAHRTGVDAEAAREVLVHDHCARGEAEARAAQQQREATAHRNRRDHQ